VLLLLRLGRLLLPQLEHDWPVDPPCSATMLTFHPGCLALHWNVLVIVSTLIVIVMSSLCISVS